MKKYFLFLLLIALGCQPITESNTIQQRTTFFDLKAYFTEEANRLQAAQIKIRKKVNLNGQVEEQEMNEINYQEEFLPFINSDINKAAWLDKYRVDSSLVDGKLQRLLYKATDKKLRTREISIQFEKSKVAGVHILNSGDNAIAETQQELIYLANQGYQIKSQQDMTLSKPRALEIEVIFLQ